MKKAFLFLLLALISTLTFSQQQYETLSNLHYYPDSVNQVDSYINERCVLDLYYPKNLKNFPTIVWFHGGGLKAGNKSIPKALQKKGVAVIAVNYRFYPKIKAPAYIEDAAAAVAWAFHHIENYGGDSSLIFVSGHSAGGYLASMVGLDKRWLKKHAVDANDIAGLIPYSGHTITHFTVREERGIDGTQPIIDDLAPLFHVRPDAPPLLLITGDREMELLGRYEENAYMMRMMKVVGHQDTRIMEIDGYGHGMTEPAHPILLREVRRIVKLRKRPNIVFIIADDASWKHFGAYGNTQIKTPNIDKLAEEGVVFENAFVSASSCSPSRAAILTGRNGFELEEGATLYGYLPAKFPTYPELLAKEGYRIGFTGKGWAPGFHVGRSQNPAGEAFNFIKHSPYQDHFDQVQISEVNYAANFASFLQTTNPDDPFCFWVGTFEPHRGYTKGLAEATGTNCSAIKVPGFMPDAPEVRADICEYYAEIEHIDRQVGAVMAALEEKDQLDNTLILFASDNGMPFPRAKATLYDYGTRMPLIAWWGKNIKGGRRVSDLISYTDIAPTLLQAAYRYPPRNMSGRSFLDILQSDQDGIINQSRDKVFMYRERHVLYAGSQGHTTPARAIRTHDYLLIWNIDKGQAQRDVDGGPTKSYMEAHKAELASLYNLSFGKRPEFELYHLPSDPFQLNNLAKAPKHKATFNDLKTELMDYLQERKDPRVVKGGYDYRYTPYFGIIHQQGLLPWAQREKWYSFSAEEKRSLLRQAYSKIGEEALFKEMLKQQQGKL